ncbi:hypothetical protein SPFM10_00182 [Salmonella phage SPFM10]|nr:hypothetical protein SPFM10_00182 [Salmonella phage SPFM10]
MAHVSVKHSETWTTLVSKPEHLTDNEVQKHMDKFAFMVNRSVDNNHGYIVLTKDGKVIAGSHILPTLVKLYPVTIDVAFTMFMQDKADLCGQLAGMADRVARYDTQIENIYPVFAVAMLRYKGAHLNNMVLTRGDEVIGLFDLGQEIVAVNLGSDVRFTIYVIVPISERLKTIHIEREYPIKATKTRTTESPRSPTIPKPEYIMAKAPKTVAKDSMASNARHLNTTFQKQLSGITSITLKVSVITACLYRHI